METNHETTATGEATDGERRAPGDRVPFEGIVEVGGSLGPSFEAQALDLSETGMHLRTAYLPELGQPLTCRLELGSDVVLAAGEVVWRQEQERGGEFGLRFTNLDDASQEALKKLCTSEPVFAPNDPGSRVRLHIEGLGSPMRMVVKTAATGSELVVGSDLGFLQVGKELELEDARTGGKRQARIDRVSVQVDPETRIPQLVVTLSYDQHDTDIPVTAAVPEGQADDTPEPSVSDVDKPAKAAKASLSEKAPAKSGKAATGGKTLVLAEDESSSMRSGVGAVLHRASEQIGPALLRFGAQAKTTFALVAARAARATAKTEEAVSPVRRTTAPAPTGGLHASGRKVVREPKSAMEELEGKAGLGAGAGKRWMAIGSALAVAGVLGAVALHKAPTTTGTPAGTTAGTAAGAPASASTSETASAAASPALATAPEATPTTPSSPTASVPVPVAPGMSTLAPPTTETPGVAPLGEERRGHGKPLHVTPFGNGPVGHANVLHLKMDGPIEKIEGATTPTGFTVVIPNRRSLEPAGPLSSRDGRIAGIRITNEGSGAELALNFRDGVPNYQVRAKGDTLEIALAPQGKVTDTDDGPKPASTRHKHPKH